MFHIISLDRWSSALIFTEPLSQSSIDSVFDYVLNNFDLFGCHHFRPTGRPFRVRAVHPDPGGGGALHGVPRAQGFTMTRNSNPQKEGAPWAIFYF